MTTTGGGNDDPRSDEELIRAIEAGDAGAFDALYYRYRDWVVGLAHRFTGNSDGALVVLQETFSYLVRKFPGFVLTARNSWIASIGALPTVAAN